MKWQLLMNVFRNRGKAILIITILAGPLIAGIGLYMGVSYNLFRSSPHVINLTDFKIHELSIQPRSFSGFRFVARVENLSKRYEVIGVDIEFEVYDCPTTQLTDGCEHTASCSHRIAVNTSPGYGSAIPPSQTIMIYDTKREEPSCSSNSNLGRLEITHEPVRAIGIFVGTFFDWMLEDLAKMKGRMFD